jgi:hypothetical protein
MLPEDELEKFFAWSLTIDGNGVGNAGEYFKLINDHTALELQEAYAMRRTMQWIQGEETEEE